MSHHTFDQNPDRSMSDLSRRTMLRGAAVSGVALPLLTACGSDGGGEAEQPKTSDATGDKPGGSPTPGGEGGGGAALTSTSEIPVGGGTVLASEKVVVTQPEKGRFKAFTAVCTHQACIVGRVEDGTIVCPCHGSMYSIEDGSVTGGPAPRPLDEIPVEVRGGNVVRS